MQAALVTEDKSFKKKYKSSMAHTFFRPKNISITTYCARIKPTTLTKSRFVSIVKL